MDLGSIIVKSLETSLKDIDTDSGDVSKSITEGINNSVLGKEANKNGDSKNVAATILKAEQEIQKIKKKNEEDDDKRKKSLLKKMFDSYMGLFKNVESNIKGGFEKTFSSLSTFTENPLMGFDKGLQNVIKSTLGTVDKIANTPLSAFKKKNNGEDEKEGILGSQLTNIGTSGSSLVNSQLEQIKTDTSSMAQTVGKNSDNWGEFNKNEKEYNDKTDKKNDNNRKEDKKEGAIKEKKRSEDSEKINSGIAKTNLTVGAILLAVGAIVLAGVAFAAVLPIIIGNLANVYLFLREKVGNFIQMIPTYFQNLMTKAGLLFEKFMVKIKTALAPMFNKLGETFLKVSLIGKKQEEKDRALAEFYGVSEEEYAAYSRNKEVAGAITDYQKNMGELTAARKEKASAEERLNEWLEKRGLTAEQAKNISEMGLWEGGSQDAEEYEALTDHIYVLNKSINKLEKSNNKILKKKYTTAEGETVTGGQIVTGGYSSSIQESIDVENKIRGNIQAENDKLMNEFEEKEEKALEEMAANTRAKQFEIFISDLTESQKQAFLKSGTWTTSKYGKGTTYQLTDEERKMLEGASTRGLNTAEALVAKGGYVGQTGANIGNQLNHDLHISALDGYNANKDPSTNPRNQTVGGGNVLVNNVQNNINASTMSGKGGS